MKRILIFISVLALALSLVTGCTADIPLDSSPKQSSATEIGKNDISESALEKAEGIVEKDGVYTTPAMVAAYIHTFNKLPQNFITKKEAAQLGWSSSKNYVSDVAPGKSIGGDTFGNREGILPKGKYRECDINYKSGKRNAERIVYNTSGGIYYTDDHYNSFTQLY